VATRLVAGVDSSTQATKVLVVDPDDGRIVASARAPHVVTGTGGARESDPAGWWQALRSALAATGRAQELAAVAVGAQQHGLVVLDAGGEPVRDAILWNDTRAVEETARLHTALGGRDRWADRIGSVPLPAFTVASWAWLRRHEPDSADRMRAIRLPHDFLTQRLCGQGVTDRGDASGTGWWSSSREDYDEDVLRLDDVQLDAEVLPRVADWRAPAGEVGRTVADELGLRPGALVGVGTGDNMAAALGLGLEPGEPVVSLGTSGTCYLVAIERPDGDPSGVIAGFADATDRFLPLACTLNCTVAVDRMAAWLGRSRDDVEPGGEVVVLPFLDGERTPDLPRAAGTVVGLRHDTSAAQILRAAYEGAVVSLLEALDRLEAVTSPLDADVPVLLIGGGARGRVWQQVTAALSGRSLVVPDAEELVALGAAAQAASLLTGERPDAVARRWGTRAGPTIPAGTQDLQTLDRIRSVREHLEGFNRAGV
jgi:xylulokinase